MWFFSQTGFSTAVQERVVVSLLSVLVVIIIRGLLIRAFDSRIEDDEKIYQWRKGITWVGYFIVFIILIRIWIDGITGFATFFGLVAAGIVVALAMPLQSVVAWLYILIYRPFSVGDRIIVGNHNGDVVDLRLFSTVIYEIGELGGHEQPSGRIIHLPNRMVLGNSVMNASRGLGLLWNEIPVLLTFESNWKAAKEILFSLIETESDKLDLNAKSYAKKAKREMKVKIDNIDPKIFTSIKESGVLLTMRYLCGVRDRRESKHRIWEGVLDAFSKREDIDFAYPTQRAYLNMYEGKLGLKGEAKNPSETPDETDETSGIMCPKIFT